MSPPKRLRWPMHVHLSTLFAALFVILAVASAVQRYRVSTLMIESSVSDLFKVINREANDKLENVVESATLAANLLSFTSLGTATSQEERLQRLPLMRQALRASPTLSALYAGYGNGDMFLLRRLRNDSEVALFKAPAGSRYILQSIERTPARAGRDAAARARFAYLDEELHVLREDDRPDYAATYDPRTRGWYQEAFRSGETTTSEPYLFFSTRTLGMTISAPVENTRTVVGADIQLDAFGALFKQVKMTPGTELALATPDGRMFAHEDPEKLFVASAERGGGLRMRTLGESGIAVLQALHATVQAVDQQDTHASVLAVQGRKWRVSITPVEAKGQIKLQLVMAVPDDELLVEARRQHMHAILFALLLAVVGIAIVVWVARRVSRPISLLAKEAEKIRRFEFGEPVQVRSVIAEIQDLARTTDSMKSTIRRFLALSQAIGSEPDFARLMPMLLQETLEAADAPAGVLYLVDGDRLQPGAASGSRGGLEALSAMALLDAVGLLGQALSQREAASGAVAAHELGSLGLEQSTSAAAALTQGLAVPLLNRARELVGCLLLLRSRPFDEAQVSFVQALSGTAASALETRELIQAQKALFESFIRLIAGAIDAKSPYTGGHCERVPELTKMLARAACEQGSGPLAGFRLNDQDWEAVHVAAWLHDCGKITTPEFVVDKAAKLETIHDRIHEVRTRFEVLKRDAEITCLREVAAVAPEAEARTRLAAELAQLDDDFAFVAACNEGGEAMSHEDLQRLREIGARTWLRTLDDRLGLSYEERERKTREPASPLPAVETLLADKPEHRIERRAADRIEPGNPWGFRMAVPELLYDRGELHNLSVTRGTLTAEDRYKINEHIVQTIRMLSTLPFPKHLRQVPELAGGHHEKMDGNGYPRRLTRSQMSPVARMMAIADVFEALTAVDRPYKKGKTLSQAIGIMGHMRRDAHIDPALFELFLRSGVYRAYAERFLKPEQIDEVDIERALAPA
ncbi:MAG: HD domain-containing phosphohydrolase [Rubrivivax sp.]